MGERYLISGVQLGTLQTLDDKALRMKVVNEIIEKQFVATSGQPIEADVHNIRKMLGLPLH